MASKKEFEADNVELRKQVERAIRELDRFASELVEIVAGRDDGEARALQTLARRTRLVAEELGEELREGLDVETVGMLVGFIRHEFTRKAIGGLIAGVAAKYGPELIEHAEVALDAVDDVLSVLSGFGGENVARSTPSGAQVWEESRGNVTVTGRSGEFVSGEEDRADATVAPEVVEETAEVPTPLPDASSDPRVRVNPGTLDVERVDDVSPSGTTSASVSGTASTETQTIDLPSISRVDQLTDDERAQVAEDYVAEHGLDEFVEPDEDTVGERGLTR